MAEVTSRQTAGVDQFAGMLLWSAHDDSLARHDQ